MGHVTVVRWTTNPCSDDRDVHTGRPVTGCCSVEGNSSLQLMSQTAFCVSGFVYIGSNIYALLCWFFLIPVCFDAKLTAE